MGFALVISTTAMDISGVLVLFVVVVLFVDIRVVYCFVVVFVDSFDDGIPAAVIV